MQQAATQDTCYWIKADGSRCQNNKLVPDAKYCHKHYWQALWAKTKQTDVPLPIRTNWLLVTGLILSLMPLAFVLIDPNYLPVYWNMLTSFSGSLIDIALLFNWFIAGIVFYLIVIYVLSLILCAFPLRPKVRRLQIQVNLFILSIIQLLTALTTVITFNNAEALSAKLFELSSTLEQGIIVLIFVLIFLAADRSGSKLINQFAVPLVALWGLVLITSVFTSLLAEKHAPLIIFTQLGFGALGIISGYVALNYRGRYFLSKLFTNIAASLADALSPGDARLLGFTQTTPGVRQKALRKALASYSNLTAIEQEELEDYILAKRRPSIFQTIVGLLSIVLSAFLLEAPAQQAFAWLTCSLLKMGAPFCP
jgi:hypothetical protein